MMKKKNKQKKKKNSAKRTAKKSKQKSILKKTVKTNSRKTARKKKHKPEIEKLEIKNITNTLVETTSGPTESKQQEVLEEKKKEQTPKTTFSKEELQHFKEILLKKREEILEILEYHRQSLIESTTQNDKPIGTPYSIHMEYGTEAEEREKTMFFIAREEKMLNYIDAALMRIERGTYGICISCGKLIDKRRLEAVPHTQLCIECKLAQKKKA